MVHVHQPQLHPLLNKTLRTQDGQDIGTENEIVTVKRRLTRTVKMMVVVMTMIVMLTILVIITTIIFVVLVSFCFTVAMLFSVPVS